MERNFSDSVRGTVRAAPPGAQDSVAFTQPVKDDGPTVFYTSSGAVLTYGPTSEANVACKLPHVCGVARQVSADAALKDHFSRIRKY